MKNKLLSILLSGVCLNLARADFNPVSLTANSYTFDIVVESNTAPPVPNCINVTAGGGTSLGDNSYYEQGMVARIGQAWGNSGIPPHGTVFTNINNANMTFLMPPTYLTNNTLMIDSTFTSGTFTFNSPTTAASLAILGAGCGGGTTVGYTVTHADSSTDTGTISFPDWFTGGGTTAWGANGRMDTSGNYNNFNGSSVNNNAPFFYANKITVSSASPVVSINFTYSSGAHANILGVSGNVSGLVYNPIPVGGFNVMAIIPAAFPLTATMDQGTNTSYNGNLATWFEQGYAPGSPTAGLPPSGSILNSQAQPTHHYQMGNYSTNNSILIDANHLVSNVKMVTPAIYTAFAFLTAGGNVGGTPMQDICILQHADGVNETNLFYGYDWFYQNAPGSLAFKANGRVNMANRTLNNVNNGFPYLFETYFTLSDLTSPVTNIVVQYKSASSGNATTYIMAISASTNPVPPVITAGPTPTSQAWYATQTATMSVTVAGSQPLTNQWMVQRNGTYVPLTDGTDANGSIISGSQTSTLSIANLSVLDGTNYIYVASNSAGTATSGVAQVSIRTGIAGVVPISGWNNIANTTYTLGTALAITSADNSLSATLTMFSAQANNGWSSGITGDGANRSLMNGYLDAQKPGTAAPTINIDGLAGASYDVYIYAFPDVTRPSSSTDGLPNYAVNGTVYYAPLIGNGASRYNSTSNSIGGGGFPGFIAATVTNANDFTAELGTNEFGNYIVIHGVVPNGGEIQVIPEADFNSFRSPVNGIELVNTGNASDDWGIHFLGNTSDRVSGTPLAPIIDSQSPSNSLNVLTNHPVVSTFSVNVDGISSPPLSYQWYSISSLNVTQAIANATNSTLRNVDTNNISLFCVVTNLAGAATSAPISISIVIPPPPSPYASTVLGLHPLAYWPLTETTGNIAFDYAGTNDGVYHGNYQLGQTGLPVTPGIGANTSASFDGTTAYVDIPSSGGAGDLNITGPVTCVIWVLVPGSAEPGFGTCLGHSDQSYRLSVINASGNPAQARFADQGPDLQYNTSIADGNWHQLVGVYDGTKEYLYVDAKLASSTTASPPTGSADDVMIAAAPDYLGSRNFQGNIAQVAIYNTALSAAQIAQIYGSLDTAPLVSITPANPSVNSGNNITLTANLSGTPATKLQWFYIDTSSVSNSIPGATNSTYTIVNPPPSYNGYTFGIIAANAYGTNIATVTLSVSTAPASLVGDLGPAFAEAYVGAPATYSVNAVGSLPINYQWTLNGTAVTGATNSSFTLPTPCGTNVIQVSFTNQYSGGTPIVSSAVSLTGDAVPPTITFNSNGTGWQLQGAGFTPTIAGNALELTDNNSSEGTSAFYVMAQYVGGFNASFTYTASGNAAADGTCFIVQNSSAGTNALGAGGGGLGYFGISNSVALEINLYQIVGIAFGTNGNTYGSGGGSIYTGTGGILINSGDPILFNLNWANGTLTVNMEDTATLVTYSTNYAVGPLQAITGSSLGYIGFSGGDGGATSIQTVSNLQFQSVIPPISLSAAPGAGNTVVISWPAADPSYELQTNTSLSLPNNWGAGPLPVTVNGVSSVTVNNSGSTPRVFYRLQRVVCP